MAPTTTILITGANRGIGKGLLLTLLLRPNHTLIAGVRDPSSASSLALTSLPTGTNSTVLIAKIDSTSPTDPAAALENLRKTHDLTHLDVVIANAGIMTDLGPLASIRASALQEHLTVNTVAPLILFQATLPYLQASTQSPKFVVISTVLGSIGDMEKWRIPTTLYGASKAALNFLVKKIHLENPSLIAFPIHPGWVQTEMGNEGAEFLGLKQAPVQLGDSVKGLIDKIDNATREETSGTFQTFDGMGSAW